MRRFCDSSAEHAAGIESSAITSTIPTTRRRTTTESDIKTSREYSITLTYSPFIAEKLSSKRYARISPKKTIEGSVVGTIMGTLIGSVYYYNLVSGVTIFETVILCLVLTLLSEVGDLFFSSIKRYFDKKDYSNLIPGHGGILDRFDSVIYVSLGLSLILSIM